jgi:hypothetical protein
MSTLDLTARCRRGEALLPRDIAENQGWAKLYRNQPVCYGARVFEDEEPQAADLERYAHACRRSLAELDWLIGRWHGRGVKDGTTRISDVNTRYLFDSTFIMAREKIYSTNGDLEHEDITIYGVSPGDEAGEMWAQVYMRGGITLRYRVEVLGTSILCEPVSYGSRLSLRSVGDDYTTTIYVPDGRGGWIEDAVLQYERDE